MVVKPIMPADQEKFMAFEGLVQWTQIVVLQHERISSARDYMISRDIILHSSKRLAAMRTFRSECHFFTVASYKLLERRDWVASFGLCASVDFGELDKFSRVDIKDLRDMHEHMVEYYQGKGRFPERWVTETPDYKADASSVVGTMIGGRLDRMKFGAAAQRLLPILLAEPTPYPNLAR